MVAVRDIGHEVGDIAARIGDLLVDVVVSKDGVDLSQNTGTVGVDEDDTDVVLLGGGEGAQRDLGHVDGTNSVSLVDVADESIGDLQTNGALGLLSGTSNMGRQDDVLERADIVSPGVEGLVEVVTIRGGLRGVDVDSGTSETARARGLDEGGDVDDGSARGVDEVGALLHLQELLGGHHPLGLLDLGDVESDEVGALEELLEGLDLLSHSEGHEGDDVVVEDRHSHGFCEHGELRSNVSIPNNS